MKARHYKPRLKYSGIRSYFSPNPHRREYILGGKADFKPNKTFNKRQLRIGAKVELEHTKSKRIAKEIARDHLAEIPDYYTRLAKMERKAMGKQIKTKIRAGAFKVFGG
jgi:hypothetical protein